MSEFLVFLGKANICFTVLYVVFYLVFRKLTFHQINRYLLLSILLLSLAIPMFKVDVHALVPIEITHTVTTHLFDLNMDIQEFSTLNTKTSSAISFWSIIGMFYWLGFVLFSFRLLRSIHELWSLRRCSKKVTKEGFHFVNTNVSNVFSFFNFIFLPRNLSDDYVLLILEHEKAHARFKHTYDLIAVELFVVLFWFNPLVYLFRKSLRSIHEFQADEAVIKKQVKKSLYLDCLFNEFYANKTSKLYSYFSGPVVKHRVEMLTKPTSSRVIRLLYLLMLPVISVLIISFTKPSFVSTIVSVDEVQINRESPLFLFPIPHYSLGDISSGFGVKGKHPLTNQVDIHGGIDIRVAEKEPVIATFDGFVSAANYKPDWGNLVVISHANGYETWYAHLHDFTVEENQIVKKGEQIGRVGNTGMSSGAHLHYELRLNGQRLNPLDLMEK